MGWDKIKQLDNTVIISRLKARAIRGWGFSNWLWSHCSNPPSLPPKTINKLIYR